MIRICYLFLLSFIFSFIVQTSFASKDEIISSLNKMSEEIRTKDSRKAVEYSLEAVKLANTGDNNSLKALSYKNLGVALYYHDEYTEALISYKKALQFYKELSDSAGISACYNNMAIIYKVLSNLEEAKTYYLKALEIDRRLKDKQGLAIDYNNLGEVFHLQGKYIIALQFYVNSLRYETEVNNLTGIADCYLNMGAAMEENGFYEKALQYYENALSYYKPNFNYFREGQCFNNMGMVYTREHEFYKAEHCFVISISKKESTNDTEGKITSFLNLGCLYILMSDTVKAKACFIKAISFETAESLAGESNSKINEHSSSQSVDDYFFNWVAYNLKNGFYNEIPHCLFLKGFIHFNLGEYSKATEYFINSLETAENLSMLSIEKDDYLYLSKSYSHLEDFKKANFYAQKYINVTDSLNSLMILDLINFKTTNSFEVNIKEGLKIKTETAESVAENKWFIITLLLTVLLSITVFLLIRNSYLKKI